MRVILGRPHHRVVQFLLCLFLPVSNSVVTPSHWVDVSAQNPVMVVYFVTPINWSVVDFANVCFLVSFSLVTLPK